MVGFFLALVLVALLASLVGPQVVLFLEIDQCLDAGGSFNSKNLQCDFAKTEKRH